VTAAAATGNADLFGSFDDTDFSYSELANANFAADTSLIGAVFADTDLCGANLATVVNYQGTTSKEQ
jgi:uncharacterized protein YjbI with pentapeptide repeats